jgi:hypothetical protein
LNLDHALVSHPCRVRWCAGFLTRAVFAGVLAGGFSPVPCSLVCWLVCLFVFIWCALARLFVFIMLVCSCGVSLYYLFALNEL